MKEINFGLGEPDFRTPGNIVDAGNRAAEEGKTKYSPVGGERELLKAAQYAFERDSGVLYGIEEIIIGLGSTQLLSNGIQAAKELTDRKQIIIITPCWRKYRGLINGAGAVCITVDMDSADGFSIDPRKVNNVVSNETAAIIVNNPSSPSGYLIPKEDLIKIGEAAVNNGAYIIYDQIYSSIVFEGQFVSIASLGKDIKGKTITIDACSKKYSMTGYRVGYCGADRDVILKMKEIQDNTVWCMNTPAQYAAIEALSSDSSQRAAAEMVQEFRKRRNSMHQGLDEIGLKHDIPNGSFSFFVQIPDHFKTSKAFAEFVKDSANVNINPGTSFEVEGYVRFTFCCALEEIKEGMDRIKGALN